MWVHLVTFVEVPDSLLDTLSNWFGGGLYGGLCLSKWAQLDGHGDLANHLCDEMGVPLTFCLENLEI
jgi:hypothetical protein